jgi:predicted AAA+ superfamily ATPase
MNMNLQQLRYLCGVVQANFSISQAARELHTSQPGISKQIQLLDDTKKFMEVISMDEPLGATCKQ